MKKTRAMANEDDRKHLLSLAGSLSPRPLAKVPELLIVS